MFVDALFRGSNCLGSLETRSHRFPLFSSSSSWVSISSPVTAPIVNGKKFPNVFSILSENEYEAAALSVTSCIMVLSVSEPAAAGFSVEM